MAVSQPLSLSSRAKISKTILIDTSEKCSFRVVEVQKNTVRIQKIADVTSVSMGYSFRSRVEPDEEGDISVVQLRNIKGNGTLDTDELVSVSLEKVRSNYWLNPRDIVLCSRGASMPAALVPDNIGKAIAASPVLLIRPTSEMLDPEYLVWFLNHPSLGQRQLSSIQRGTSMPIVNKKELLEIEVVVPSMADQTKISALSALHLQESSLLEKIQEKRNRYMNAVLMKCMNGEL